ncbi:type II toxin-antitoxin system RelE family toxin [Geovibrio ferrireducens]|uniref:type II toxin-antitoxin system RelE family toxin n=1 Tax=Geovibrio ferrireducens TaxID=46201 RepID=UPI0022464E21|nr:type II toxin-antitoxin system RelE/ParE family toxin [Geovibrio ferrireducens]
MKLIEWTMKALRQAKKIKDSKIRAEIYDAVDSLKDFPDCRNIKKLVGRGEYRLRVGNYRVIFTESLTIIRIEEVKKRDEHTY